MKKATFYKKEKGKVRCLACNQYCLIANGKTGICGVRKNVDGDLYLVVYGRVTALHIDPIEKKPIYHFLPGTEILSLGTHGCNFHCTFCQNADISQTIKNKIPDQKQILRSASWRTQDDTKESAQENNSYLGQEISPEDIVDLAIKNDLPSIAYTYNEPTIFVEFALETMKLAQKAGLKNVWVSNGYMSKEVLPKIIPYLDAINVDLKAFSEKFYRTICGASLEPVLENIKKLFAAGVHLELTTLIIEGLNDDVKEIKLLTEFIRNVSPSIPWHISRFFPTYKMLDKPVTSLESLERIAEIGKKSGLKNIHIGNV